MRNFFNQFKSLSRIKQIAIAVCLAHCSFALVLFIQHIASRSFKPTKPMVVRVVPPAPTPVIATQPTAPKPKAPKATPPPPTAQKKSAPAPNLGPGPVKPKAPKTPIPAPTPHHDAPPEPPRPKPALTIPSKVAQKVEPPPEQKNEPSMSEFLVAYLQSTLELPEYGEVRVKIEIDRSGTLVSCEILEAKSKKNSDFLKNRLPELIFPCLNNAQSFTITFRNVEIR